MPVYTPPPVEPVSARLTLAGREVDLATRALVVAVVPSPTWARESEVLAAVRAAGYAGADLAEVPADPRLLGPAARQGGLPVAARVSTAAGARGAGAAGAELLLVPTEHLALVDPVDDGAPWRPGEAFRLPTAVLVREAAAVKAAAVEIGDGGVVALDTVHMSGTDLVAEATLALSLGARMLRTVDVRRSRRVIEVMAALLEARR